MPEDEVKFVFSADTAKGQKAIRDLRGSLKSTGDAANQMSKTGVAANSKFSSSIGKLATVGKTGLAAIGVAFVAVGAAGFKAAVDIDNAMKTIRVGTGATGEQLKSLGATMRSVYVTVPQDIGQVATVIADLNTRLDISGTNLEKMSQQILNLSRITKTDAATNVENLTRLFADWSIATADQSDKLDYLFKSSQSTGIAISKLSELVVQYGAPMRALGFTLEESAALMGKWSKEGVNMETVTSGLRYALGQFAKAGEAPSEAFQKVSESIKNASSETEAVSIAFKTFGQRAAIDMMKAMQEGRFEVDALVKSLQGSSESIEKAARASLGFGDKIKILKNILNMALEPAFAAILDVIFDLIGGINTTGTGIQKLARLIAAPVRAFMTLMKAIHAVNQAFIKMAIGISKGIIAFDKMLGKFSPFGDLAEHNRKQLEYWNDRLEISEEASSYWGEKIEKLNESLNTFGETTEASAGAIEKVGNKSESSKQKIRDLVTELDALKPDNAKQIEDDWGSILDAMASKADSLRIDSVSTLKDSIEGLGTKVAELPTTALGWKPEIEATKTSIDDLLKPDSTLIKLPGQFGKVKTEVTGIGTEVSTVFTNMAQNIADAIVKWQGLWNALKDMAINMGKAVLSKVIEHFLKPLVDAVSNALTSMVESVIGGIGSAFAESLKGTAGQAVGKLTEQTQSGGPSGWGQIISTAAQTAIQAVGTARMSGKLKGIEQNTRYTSIDLKTLLEETQTNQGILWMLESHFSAIWGTLEEIKWQGVYPSRDSLQSIDRHLANLAEFQSGSQHVEKSGVAVVHEGERIIPARQDRTDTNIAAARSSGDGVTLVVNISGDIAGQATLDRLVEMVTLNLGGGRTRLNDALDGNA